ncbi:MAG: helicase [Verrucomicrobia bacterium]|nr:helicase [Verrucomicrobiota bacterium]
MIFDLDQRTAALGVGEFAGFTVGPRESGGTGAAGLWRAQLGSHWHRELQARASTELAERVAFEVSIAGRITHRGWTLTLSGRIDQQLDLPAGPCLREIKSVTCALPADESVLRRDYPAYFVQLATYATLARLGLAAPAPADVRRAASDPPTATAAKTTARGGSPTAELLFVEADSGLVQTVVLTPADEALFKNQLERVVEFLELRLRARTRLRSLRYRPAFAVPRPGQETTRAELTALFQPHPLVCFEAPTGFGKTGVLLEFALGQLRSGHFDRVLYLTSKATGQLQVVRTLASMTGPDPGASLLPGSDPGTGTPVAAWHVRNKAEHCVNHTFHCVRDVCGLIAGAAERWAGSGLARFYLDEHHARDLEALRSAGAAAQICPYEITRTALAHHDVWIGDYNYVFAPRNRSLFFEQPGFAAPRTLLLVDEAHNLPARVADAYSHGFGAARASAVREELHRLRAPAGLVRSWDHWCHFLQHLRATDGLPPADEDDARHLLREVARHLTGTALDFAALGSDATEALWQIPALLDDLDAAGSPSAPDRPPAPALPRLWWAPREGELLLTCLDAAPAIGATLREFGGAVLASATLSPLDGFAAACGLDAPPDLPPPPPPPSAPERLGALNKRDTRKLFRQLTSGAELLRVEEARQAAAPVHLRAVTPWREHSYDLAFDARVDTSFQHRSHHYATTAATIAALSAAAGTPIAVFFPSYAYAESIVSEASNLAPALRLAVQPRLRDLAAQSAWVEESLALADALFLVLGSSFAEGIDSLGGRISHALVVGPALPEVNPVQRARLTEATSRLAADTPASARSAAFRLVYQIPGMTKVNQALGRLVRAPGQHARVILHCRRFLDPGYASLLAPEYQLGANLHDDRDLADWLCRPFP